MEGKEARPRFKKGFWKPEEDLILKKYVESHGEGNWTVVSKESGLLRGAKSCRLRWKNYLRPSIKRGMMSEDEKDLIIRLHKLLGNRWSLIAGRLPGRTDNEVKNYWNTHLNKRASRDQITHLDSQTQEKQQLSLGPQIAQDQENQLQTMTVEHASTKEGEIRDSTDRVVDSWAEENLKNVDYGMDMPRLMIPPDYSSLLFHNYEAFMPMLDNLVFLEPFGSSSGSGAAADEIIFFQ